MKIKPLKMLIAVLFAAILTVITARAESSNSSNEDASLEQTVKEGVANFFLDDTSLSDEVFLTEITGEPFDLSIAEVIEAFLYLKDSDEVVESTESGGFYYFNSHWLYKPDNTREAVRYVYIAKAESCDLDVLILVGEKSTYYVSRVEKETSQKMDAVLLETPYDGDITAVISHLSTGL